MGAFLDIADAGQTATAPLRGAKVDIYGLSARQIAALLVNHQSVQQFMDGTPVNMLQLIKLAPDAVSVAIAYGTGHDESTDKEKFNVAVEKAAGLAAGEQYDLLLAIFDLTFGERLNPFVKALVGRLSNRLDATVVPQQQQRPKSVKELKDSLRSVTRPEMFGITPQSKSPPIAA